MEKHGTGFPGISFRKCLAMSGAQSNHVCAEMNTQLMLHVDDVLFVGQVLGRTVFAKVEGAFQRKCISLKEKGAQFPS